MLLQKKYLSIQLGKEQVKIVYLSKSKYKITVFKTIEINIAGLIGADQASPDMEKLSKVIKEALNEAGIKEKKAIFSIYHGRMITREVELPNLPSAKLGKIVRANLQDYFPVDITDYLVGHAVLETKKEENKAKVLLVAVPNSVMSNYMELCDLLKLDLIGVDYQENSIAHFMNLQQLAGTYMDIHIGEEASTVIIGEDEKIKFTKTVPIGMVQLVHDVQRQYGCDYKEASQKIMKEDLLSSKGNLEMEIHNEVKNNIKYILNNVTSYMKYYANQADAQEIQEVYLSGIGGQIKGISSYIEEELQISTGNLAMLNNVVNKDTDHPNLLTLGIETNMGAAFYNINLLPEELTARQKSKEHTRLVILSSILVVLSVSSILIKPMIQIKDFENKSEQLQAEIEGYKQIETVKVQYDKIAEELGLRKQLMDQADTYSDHLLEIINGLEMEIPKGISLQSLNSTKTGISMNCIAEDRLSVARFISVLKNIEGIGEVYVDSTSEVEDPNTSRAVIQFSVNCTYEEVTP